MVVALAILAGCAASAALAPAALAGLPALLVLVRGGRWRLALVAVLCFLAALGRASACVRGFERRVMVARDALGVPSRCSGRGTVVTSPVLARGVLQMDVAFAGLQCERGDVPGPVGVRLYGGPPDSRRGDQVEVVAQLATVRLFRNVEVTDPVFHAARRGTLLSGGALSVDLCERGSGWSSWVDRARAYARRRILATFTPAASGLARALVLGENDLSEADSEAFKASGLAHLLAVSGTHLVFAVVAVVNALAFLLVRVERLAARVDVRRIAATVGIGLALAYADFAGGSGSAWRAAWMLVLVFGARALNRQADPVRALCASLLVGSVVDPLVSFDISFLLSAIATWGLLAIGAPAAERLRFLRPMPVRFLVVSAVVTLSAMLPCAPLLALLNPSLSAVGVLANVLAAPIGELSALPLCLAHPLLGFWPTLERGAALAASGSLLVVAKIAHVSASATWAAVGVPVPSAWHLAVLAGGVSLVVLTGAQPHRPVRAILALTTLLGLAMVEWAIRSAGAPRGVLRATFIDVGQGDSVLVDLPDGRAMLVDGGGFAGSSVDPGRLAVLPLLRARRRHALDVAVLTHPHPDHFLGLISVLDQVPVEELWTSSVSAQSGAGPEVLAWLDRLRRRGVRVRGPEELCERSTWFGHAELQVVGPCPAVLPGRGANDNSLVVRIVFGNRAVLLPGDAEYTEERDLLERHAGRLRADLLKAGHHGSRTSTSSEFLSAVDPELVVISSGVRNRFGHPHPEMLRRLREFHLPLLRTDRVGAIVWQTDGLHVHVHGYARVGQP